jgi:hypothetical protein
MKNTEQVGKLIKVLVTVPLVIPSGKSLVGCADGTYSLAGGSQGACSHHGGCVRPT